MYFAPRASLSSSGRVFAVLGSLFVVLLLSSAQPPAAHADIICEGAVCTCNGDELVPGADHHDKDLRITGKCEVKQSGAYSFRNVSIYSTSPNLDPDFDSNCEGPALIFADPPDKDSPINFSASSILVENNGCLKVGGSDPNSMDPPIGTNGGVVTIHLYGKDQGAKSFDMMNKDGGVGVLCRTEENAEVGPCGIPKATWDNNGQDQVSLPGNVEDFFYQYGPMPYDDGMENGKQGFFGYKVLAVSYGGTLRLHGKKGALYPDDLSNEAGRQNSGKSWARLSCRPGTSDPEEECEAGTETLKKGEDVLRLDRVVDWLPGDEIIVTTTDYVPGHSEQLKIESVITNLVDKRTIITVEKAVEYDHNADTYPLRKRRENSGGNPVPMGVGPDTDEVETRAAVALLTRSIRIVSGGDEYKQPLPSPDECEATEDVSENKHPCYFGGHAIARQGFLEVKVQGVEFYQMGQGGRIGHYPFHFHVARLTPDDTFVKDSSIHDSMTRWIVLHGTRGRILSDGTTRGGVTLARNVGYKSIGHGYYLEDGTETNNRLYSNIGILALGAVQNPDGAPQKQNPRQVPGILAWPDTTCAKCRNGFPQGSDFVNPTVFWFTNSWNDFEGNMAAGATTCGATYWPVTAAISGPSANQKWAGYANIRPVEAGQGATGASAPLKSFKGNYSSTAQWSFSVTGGNGACAGVNQGDGAAILRPVPNALLPPPHLDPNTFLSEAYYPRSVGAFPNATLCDVEKGEDCSKIKACGPADLDRCMVTTLDTYTSSFHWAEGNFSAIWLRHAWFVLLNSALTDVQGGGVSFVTGGSYTQSDVPPGGFMLTTHSVFIGQTQKDNPFASDVGPFNPQTKGILDCEKNGNAVTAAYCLARDEGLSMPTGTGFMNFQRMMNIYDGPFFEDANAFLDITRSPLTDCHATKQCNIQKQICAEGAPDGPLKCVNYCDNDQLASCTTDADCKRGDQEGSCLPQSCSIEPVSRSCDNSEFMWGRTPGIRYDSDAPFEEQCYLPNAAIAWKQSNGFFYPPAFNSRKLFFDNVDIRHYVVEPLFLPEKTGQRPFRTDVKATRENYCNFNDQNWINFSAIDRQTVLNDDDGSLTGLFVDNSDLPGGKQATISVNQDTFFSTPVETFQCRSDRLVGEEGTAKTSPYEYVTTVVYPGCATKGQTCPNFRPPGCEEEKCEVPEWSVECGNSSCYGVPLYRQYVTGTENENPPDPNGEFRKIRMMGPAINGRINLTTNNGLYYVDATPGRQTQSLSPLKNIFKADETYYVFLLFAKPSTEQTYQIWVGDSKFNKMNDVKAQIVNLTTLEASFSDTPEASWPEGWTRCYGTKDDDPECQASNSRRKDGILEVTMNMNTFTENFVKAREDNCQPESFCTFNGKCGCSEQLEKDDPELFKQCEDKDICSWSGKEIDCPVFNGQPRCLGFSVKLASSFHTDDQPFASDPRPDPLCFDFTPENRQKWEVPFTFASQPLAGDCFESPVGMTNFCHGGGFPNVSSVTGTNGVGTSEARIKTLISDLQMLIGESKITARHAKGPAKQLSKALRKLERGKSACSKLAKFVRRINKRVKKGKLMEEDAQPLINDASRILADMGCSA